MKRLPLIPTLLVLIAVAVMVRLGFWQIDRMHQKENALASYRAATANQATVTEWELGDAQNQLAFRRVKAECPRVSQEQLVAGRNAKGESGWAHVVICAHYGFDVAPYQAIVLGWSKDLRRTEWKGGDYAGILVPGQKGGVDMSEAKLNPDSNPNILNFHIVADPPLVGLEANARPDPNNIPNNHWSYAIQWFLFALTALVIYGLALRTRLRG